MIQWLIDEELKKSGRVQLLNTTVSIIHLNFAAIHTSSLVTPLPYKMAYPWLILMHCTIWFPILSTLPRSEKRLNLQLQKVGLCHLLKNCTNSILFSKNPSAIIHRVPVASFSSHEGTNCSRTLQNGCETLPLFKRCCYP